MTKENHELDFNLLNDLVMQLEFKEALKNGDMAQVVHFLKQLTRVISSIMEMQRGEMNGSLSFCEVTTKAIASVTDRSMKQDELILELAERINILEEAKK
tara:strand:+ start:131 stop:430 length:300 start_codon:yes stop_codon:yes gene_type:complete